MKKQKKQSMVDAARDVGLGGASFGITSDIVGRVPGGSHGAAALATGASFMPVYATARIGSVIVGEMEDVGKKNKNKRPTLF